MKLRVRILRRAQQDIVALDRYLEIEKASRPAGSIDGLLDAIERLGQTACATPSPHASLHPRCDDSFPHPS